MQRFLTVENYSKYSHYFLLAYCLSASISIAASQIILGSLILYSIVLWFCYKGSRINLDEQFVSPFLYWILVCLISGFVGIAPWRSFQEVLKTSFFLSLPFVIYYSFNSYNLSSREYLQRIESYIIAFIFSQSLAAVHSVFRLALNIDLPQLLPGAVTESGQIVLIMPLVLLSIFHFFSNYTAKEENKISIFGLNIPIVIFTASLFSLFLVIAWPDAIMGDDLEIQGKKYRFIALFLILILTFPILWRSSDLLRDKLFGKTKVLNLELFHLTWVAVALLLATLLINLKRGPWFGVFIEVLVIGFFISRRLIIWSVALAALLIFSLTPARERVFNISEHFNISGGRKVMWQLGVEFSQRFPLGLGLNNAKYMRELDNSIPPEHRHMHNNLLNVLVETGWLGLSVFVFWMYYIYKLGFSVYLSAQRKGDKLNMQLGSLALYLTAALIGWQFSGLVEYNFGDGEIRLIAFFFMGLLFVISSLLRKSEL